ncbi:MAG: exopolysaccharide biosynthesis protein [Verrucomicrobiota bacterium]
MPLIHPEPLPTPVIPALLAPLPAALTVPSRFSQDLRDLAQRFADRPVRLSEILSATQDRGFNLLLLLIGLPFLTPIPLPGLSTPFGLMVLAIGARLALGQQPWLPEKLLQRELPARFIARLLATASRVVRWLEFLLRPRLDFLHGQWIYRRIAGTLIMLSGLFLLLPLPIPLTNSFPALTVVLLAAGAMERDGLFFLAGCAMFTATLAYFGLLAFGGVHLLDNLWRTIFGL